jgi:hypothetical protein
VMSRGIEYEARCAYARDHKETLRIHACKPSLARANVTLFPYVTLSRKIIFTKIKWLLSYLSLKKYAWWSHLKWNSNNWIRFFSIRTAIFFKQS